MAFSVQILIILACLFYGARKGGVALGLLGGIGLVLVVFAFDLDPGKPPVDVILTIVAVVAASAGQLQLNVMEPVITFALFTSIATMQNAVESLRTNCVDGITANAEHSRDMVLNSLGIVTVLKPSLGYKQCAEIAREGYETGKSLHDIVVKERKLLTQEKWDEVFSFENLISPKFEQ